MFKQLIELVQQLVFLLRDVQQNKEDIAKLRSVINQHDSRCDPAGESMISVPQCE